MLSFRPTQPAEIDLVRDFICRLAEHEGRPEAVTATTDTLAAAFHGNAAVAQTYFCEQDGQVCAFAIVYRTFASFSGRASLYIEDLYVLPERQGRGIGRAFMEYLHAEAKNQGYGSLGWSVLKSNPTAIAFYERLGARKIDAWDHYGWDC